MMLKRIKELRKAAGLSQEQLAARAGLTHVTVGNAENGNRVTITTATKLAKALGVPLASILDEEVTNG